MAVPWPFGTTRRARRMVPNGHGTAQDYSTAQHPGPMAACKNSNAHIFFPIRRAEAALVGIQVIAAVLGPEGGAGAVPPGGITCSWNSVVAALHHVWPEFTRAHPHKKLACA